MLFEFESDDRTAVVAAAGMRHAVHTAAVAAPHRLLGDLRRTRTLIRSRRAAPVWTNPPASGVPDDRKAVAAAELSLRLADYRCERCVSGV